MTLVFQPASWETYFMDTRTDTLAMVYEAEVEQVQLKSSGSEAHP
jgi:hypothetical protein